MSKRFNEMVIGRDLGDPVTPVHRVAVDVSGQPYIDLKCEAQAMLMRE
jgi:hypothetical protein